MPSEWMRSILVPIFKNKGMCKVVLIIGDQTSEPYNEAICDRIVGHCLRGVTNVTEIRFGFMPERSTMETSFLIR
jgi:hypothetical protein